VDQRGRRLLRGVFGSITDLQAAINRYLAEHNENPKPFVWKADPSRILAAIERGKQALELGASSRAGKTSFVPTRIASASAPRLSRAINQPARGAILKSGIAGLSELFRRQRAHRL
jgi:hypothetical protein